MFKILGCGQNRLDGTHSIVIMILCGKLLRTKSVSLNNFLGQGTGLEESIRIE
jgi:hypothetical protein